MSIIVRDLQTNEIILFTKGADTSIIGLINNKDNN